MMCAPSSRRAITIAGALTLLAFAGCSPSAANQEARTNDEALRTMVANDRQQIEALQQQVAREEDRITELEHGGGAGGKDSLAALEARVSKLEGQAPGAQASASPAASPGAEASPSADIAPDAAAGEPGATPPESGALASPAAEASVASAPPPAFAAPPAAAPAPTWQSAAASELAATPRDPAAKLYRAGLAAMKSGNYQAAIAKFDELQRRYPKSQLSGSAEYFAGNARFEMGQYEKAILQFNDLGSRFPEGRFTSAALFREAQAFTKINDPIDARLTLQKLLNEHPNAPEGPQAKAMLDSLSS
jgi:tol-pal system protein YbgF